MLIVIRILFLNLNLILILPPALSNHFGTNVRTSVRNRTALATMLSAGRRWKAWYLATAAAATYGLKRSAAEIAKEHSFWDKMHRTSEPATRCRALQRSSKMMLASIRRQRRYRGQTTRPPCLKGRRRWDTWCLPPLSIVKIEIFIAKNLQRFYSSSEHDNEEGDVELDEEVLLRSLETDLSLMRGDLSGPPVRRGTRGPTNFQEKCTLPLPLPSFTPQRAAICRAENVSPARPPRRNDPRPRAAVPGRGRWPERIES